MDRGQPVPLQLVGDDVDQGLEAGVVVCPVANNLLAVGQVAVGIGKVGLQLESRPVGLYGFGDVARVLVNRGQVGVGCGKVREDFQGLQVEPSGLFDVALLP